MTQEFTYTELMVLYDKADTGAVGTYWWMSNYCQHYVNNHPELSKVTLTLDGDTHADHLKGKVYEFEREVRPEEVKLRVNRD